MKKPDTEQANRNATLTEASTKILSLSVAQIKSILSDGGDSINELTDSFVELASTFNELVQHKTDIDHTDLKLIQKQIEQGIISFQFYDRISQRLDHVANSLQQMSSIIENESKRDNEKQWQQLSQNIFNKYTMESERQLFDCIDQGMSAEAALQKLTTENDGHSHTGDIELF